MKIRQLSIVILAVYAGLVLYTTSTALFGQPFQPLFTPLLSLLAFGFAVLHSSQQLGWRKALLLLGLTFGVSLLFECVGVATGWVYGPYHYTDKLGPKFLGLVPLLIPVAWFMMTYPAYIIAQRLIPAVKRVWVWRLMVAGVGALIMTAWDLAMDPLMVAGGHWVWEKPGAYFGVPLQNYWGWWLTVFVAFVLFLTLAKVSAQSSANKSSHADHFERLAILSYAITGLSSVLIDFRYWLSGPGLVGLFAMLPWVIMGWQERK